MASLQLLFVESMSTSHFVEDREVLHDIVATIQIKKHFFHVEGCIAKNQRNKMHVWIINTTCHIVKIYKYVVALSFVCTHLLHFSNFWH